MQSKQPFDNHELCRLKRLRIAGSSMDGEIVCGNRYCVSLMKVADLSDQQFMFKSGGFVEALNLDRPPEDTAQEIERYL